ncbi:MAG: branched-chain amino acid ABC transporter permease [Micromonosporaceae bacterium]
MIGWFDANLVSIVDGVAYGLLLFTLAAGLSLVFGMMDVLNLAHGTLYLAGAYLTFLISGGGWFGFFAAIAAGVAIGATGGALLTAMTQPLARRGHLDQALLTVGVSLIGAEIFLVVSGGDPLPANAPAALDGSLQLAGHAYPTYRLVFIGVAALLAVLVYALFERSTLGALVRATVADREMVQALGVDTRKVLLGVFAFGGALAAVGGVLGAPIIGPAPGVDENVLVLSLVVVVVGGLGSIRGALVGALYIGQVQSLGVALVPQYAPFLLFGSMFLVLALRPQGLVSIARTA